MSRAHTLAGSLGLLLALVFLSVPAAAQTSGTQITGSGTAVETGPDGTYADPVTFTCFGRPVCTGTYVSTYTDSGCSNSHAESGTISLTGVTFTGPGSFAGNVTITSPDEFFTHNPNGTCTYVQTGSQTSVFPYTGTWDGSRGTVSFSGSFEPGYFTSFTGTFTQTGSPQVTPAFPVTVTGSITPTTANAQATFQPRAQEAGTTQSVYVFALAPPGMLKGATQSKDAPVACVLAQLNANGELKAV